MKTCISLSALVVCAAREPSQQGFDEYYGIPRTSNEAQTTIAQGQTAPGTSFLWEGKTGEPPSSGARGAFRRGPGRGSTTA